MEPGQLQDRKPFETKKMYTYLILIVVVSLAVATIWKFIDSRNWLETKGQITHISLEEEYNRPISSASANRQFTDYKIDLKYDYSHDGREYTGTHIYPIIPNIFTSKTQAEDMMNVYKVNEDVNVYFNPSDPANSCLITTKNLSLLKVFLFALIFTSIISLGIAAFIYLNKHVFS